MHDIVIRGGTIVDGTGAAAFTGDVAIEGERIAAVGGKAGPARRVIDADGMLVTPGWVDVHTHYDGQATWDPILAPSSWHGVTTILFGNCGVGFAPVRPHHRAALIDLMEGVEDIPGPVLAEGLKWDWESFPDFLDALDRMPRTIDVAAQIPHHPLRVYAMGDRAIRRERATGDDIALMRQLTQQAVQAGAFGFTTSRTNAHKTTQGEMVPGRFAEIEELTGIGGGLGALGAGAFGMNSDFEDETAEFEWITRLGRETRRPVWFLLTDRPTDPQRWRRIMAGVHRARAAGASVTAQIAGRPVGVILGVATSLNPFSIREQYQRFEALPLAERLIRLRDPAGAPGDPRRPAVAPADGSARAVGTASREPLGPHVCHRQPARLRAARRGQRRVDRGAHQPHARGGRLRLSDRGGRQFAVLPGHRLCAGRPRTDPRNAVRSGHIARARRWWRACRDDRRRQHADLYADPLDARPQRAAPVCRSNSSSNA